MSKRSARIARLHRSRKSRESYIRAKLEVLILSQLYALGINRKKLERLEGSEINLDDLIKLAAMLKVGLIIKFASFGDMLEWDNSYSQDDFSVVKIEEDKKFNMGINNENQN